ncbi:SHOCT domain-containing protein [Streptomyces sp. A0592]|uniref:SHOCT domain-containing protein n=1 Tax=Streptomyces sp. A0592 TaxID=2563099 RepID=UPI00109E81F2|nr:SHOCT domain-containing protein [Streptomyces sp. A0592]THA81075.1 SHOCT domain-containing protein [Streptomyces sp. A0592]
MFIRPMGVTVRAANRPAGSPLLRGLLARASGAAQETAGAVRPEEPPHRGLLARGVRAAEPELVEEEPEPEPEPNPLDEPDPESEPEPEPEPEPDTDYEPEPEPEPEPMDGVYWDTHPEPGPAAPVGLAAELRQLADLAREGLLTPQEFTTAKARLLND